MDFQLLVLSIFMLVLAFDFQGTEAEISWLHKARQKIKTRILKGLGMTAPPVLSDRQRFLYRLRSIRVRRERNSAAIRTYRAWAGPPTLTVRQGQHRFFFAVERCKEGYSCVVLGAVLKIYFKLKVRGTRSRAEFISVTINDGRYLLMTENRWLHNSSWVGFNIKPAVEQWVSDPKSNQGITITIKKGNIKAALRFWKWKNEKIPFPNPILRVRSVSKPERTHGNISRFCTRNADTHCCRRRFYLDFHSLGWDWIVRPRKLQVNICHGDCNITLSKTSRSSLLQRVIKLRSCCYPTQYSPNLITYFSDDGKLLTKTVRDISVDKCECPL